MLVRRGLQRNDADRHARKLGDPVSCNATTSYVTDPVSIPELNTAAAANNLVLKVYMRNSGARKASIELVQVDLNYYLD